MSFQYVESTSESSTSPVLLSDTGDFPYRIIHQPLIVHFFIDDIESLKLPYARHANVDICTKNNRLVIFDNVFDSFFKLFFCFRWVSIGVYSTFLQVCSSHVLLIYYQFFILRKIHHHRSTCCIVGFLHQCIETL